MKPILYVGLAIGLVPIQTTVLEHASVGGVRPDLCFIAVCLVGFFGGPLDGILLGALLGFEQDLLSAGSLWINLGTKAVIGLLSGLAGRYVAQATPASMLPIILGLSVLSGLVALGSWQATEGLADAMLAVRAIVLPQAAWDAVIGVGLYWLLAQRVRRDEAPV